MVACHLNYMEPHKKLQSFQAVLRIRQAAGRSLERWHCDLAQILNGVLVLGAG